jgi:hypothetical protein
VATFTHYDNGSLGSTSLSQQQGKFYKRFQFLKSSLLQNILGALP